MSPAAAALAELLTAHRYTWRNEYDLQDGLASVLTTAGHDPAREVDLKPGGRIDLLVGRVGIEVKVNGTTVAAMRQLQRYAANDGIDALVLATTRLEHCDLPPTIAGVPVVVAYLIHLA